MKSEFEVRVRVWGYGVTRGKFNEAIRDNGARVETEKTEENKNKNR